MNPIERHYRLTVMNEQIAQIDGALLKLLDGMPAGPQQDQLLSASWHLVRAMETIAGHPAPKEQKQTERTDLESMLRLSIEDVLKRKERQRCADIGGSL